jgi:hypothetical protein
LPGRVERLRSSSKEYVHTLAEPNIAFGYVVIGLRSRDLELALYVAIRIRGLAIVDLLTACCFHSRAGKAGVGRGDTAMG